MTKKAVLCFVGKYQTYAQELAAPANEWKLWYDLLSEPPYSFDSIVPLVDDGKATYTPVGGSEVVTKSATAENVLAEIGTLLTGASKNDQLVFVYGGHGSQVVKDDGSGLAEEALIVFPNGNAKLPDAAVRETAIATKFQTLKPPIGTDITFVLDTCFSGGFGSRFGIDVAISDVLSRSVILSTPRLLDSRKTWNVLRFGSFATASQDEYETPVYLAACGPDQEAREIDDNGTPRLLFTAQILNAIREKPDKMSVLIDKVNDFIEPRYDDQTAVVVGNSARAESEAFPGEPDTVTSMQEKKDLAIPLASSTQGVIHARVMGIAVFVDARDASKPFKARVILPHDKGDIPEVGKEDRHFACIQFNRADIEKVEGSLAPQPEIIIGPDKFVRWLLKGHTVSVLTGDFEKPFKRTQAFLDHVPRLTTLCEELEPKGPRPGCFDTTPRLDRFAAFLNIPSGTADIGPLHKKPTNYVRAGSEEPVKTYHSPRFVTVEIPYISAKPRVVLTPFGAEGSPDLTVTLKAGATLLFANAREIDITGDGGEADKDGVPREQFLLNYRTACISPRPPVFPAKVTVPVDDCTPTDFP